MNQNRNHLSPRRSLARGLSGTPLKALAVLFLFAGASWAQGSNIQDKIRKQMEEISQLMRDSERLLLEISKSEKLAEQQAEIVRKLKELEKNKPPQSAESAAAQQRLEQERKKREQLQQQQLELEKKLGDMLGEQKSSSDATVVKLVELLANLPRQQGGSGGEGQHKPQKRKPRERDPKKDQINKRDKQPNKPRSDKDKKRQQSERERDKKRDPSRLQHIEAWITRLPPAVKERINRNDLSDIPQIYRDLVREYTARRAKREAEEESDR